MQRRARANRQKAIASFFHGLLCAMPVEGVAQIQDGSSHPEWCRQESPHQHAHMLGFQLIPDTVKLTKISHDNYYLTDTDIDRSYQA